MYYTVSMPNLTIDQARSLMHEWTASPALRIHMESVAACVAAYARKLSPDQTDRWTVAGLLHDYDYEKHPTQTEHPFVGVKHLESLGVDEEIRRAILAHAQYSGVPRDTPLAKVLFACDELAGFIVACTKVRPDGFASLQASSVKKKLKDKAFAANVSREDIKVGVAELAAMSGQAPEVFEPVHIQACIDAIKVEAPRLGM